MIQDTAPATIQARLLQLSASRKIWGNLFRVRDWTSYIYLPLLFLLLILAPYFMVRLYLTSNRVNRLVKSVAHANPQIDILSQLMAGPMKPFPGEPSEEVRSLEPPNYQGFTILQDSCILDLRRWNPGDSTSLVYGSRRLKVLKGPNNPGNEFFRVVALMTHSDAQFRFPPSQYQPRLRRMCGEDSSTQEASCHFEVDVDLSMVPSDQVVDVAYEHYSREGTQRRGKNSTTVAFRSDMDALEFTRWLLLPMGKEYRSYQILRYEKEKPGTAEVVKGLTYMVDDPGIIAFKLASVKAGYTYEISWFHK
jgi:hypothetical protein